ncbi:MAG TPA: phosphate ABC transporter substrate-binding protein [Ktedonobacteraceae bacterium]|jgi:phosphate transport system substrate-binding protein|nr:phosphate ABC transporter substrate-binding protein [Ktedonobacteraceae bacterium]
MTRQWRISLLLGVAIAISIIISACGGSGTGSGGSTPTTGSGTSTGSSNCVQGSITAAGSTALQPLVQAVAQKYEAQCSGANITVQGGGSKTGLGEVEAGSIQIGDSDVFAASNQSDLVDHQVAVVTFVLDINPDVTGVTSLTSQQILGIYTGQITNWNQVGGPNLPIVVVSRPVTSGTRATFKQYILNGTAESPAKSTNLTADSSQLVLQTVEQTSGAIGYTTLGDSENQGSKVVILNIDGNAPTPANVENNTYKFWNIEHMYTKGQPSGLTASFLTYMGSSDAETAASQLKFLLLNQMSQPAIQAHQPSS